MKKTLLAAMAAMILTVGLSAERADSSTPKTTSGSETSATSTMMSKPGMMGEHSMMGGFSGMEWKIGNSVTMEYKQMTGQIVILKLNPTFKSSGVEYTLALPAHASMLLDVKNGDTISFEGIVVTTKTADSKTMPSFRPFKATLNGKEIDLKPGMFDSEGRFASK